jgi:glycosyltransferase involved in cell wall biosynthesis
MSEMAKNGIRCVIVIPIYPPSPGGGAVYADFLSRGLVSEGIADRLQVITEYKKHQAMYERSLDGAVRVHRSLANFFTLERRFAWRYLTYLFQCAQMVGLCIRLGFERPDVVIFHSSFFVHPSLNALATRILRRLAGACTRMVLDVRDMGTPESNLERLGHFDLAIGCSRLIVDKLSRTRAFVGKAAYVPVAVPKLDTDPDSARDILTQFGLRPRKYLLNANGIVDRKGFPTLYDAWREVIKERPGIDLVVAGPILDWEERYGETQSGGRLIVLGPQTNETVRLLTSEAAVHVNPSPREGLPRSTLEAMMAKVPVLVPEEGVREFDSLPERFKAPHSDIALLADRVRALLDHPETAPYAMVEHNVGRVLRLYGRLLSGMSINQATDRAIDG